MDDMISEQMEDVDRSTKPTNFFVTVPVSHCPKSRHRTKEFERTLPERGKYI
jgi:hypothetical protein